MAFGFNPDRSKYDLDGILEEVREAIGSSVLLVNGTALADSVELTTITDVGNYYWQYEGNSGTVPTDLPDGIDWYNGLVLEVGELPDVVGSTTTPYLYQRIRAGRGGAEWYRTINMSTSTPSATQWTRLTPEDNIGGFVYLDYGQAANYASNRTYGSIGFLSVVVQTSSAAGNSDFIRVGSLGNTGLAPSSMVTALAGNETGNLATVQLRTNGDVYLKQQTAGSHWYNINMVYPYDG